jgi:hypothetical protein
VFVFGPATILVNQSSKQNRRVDHPAGHYGIPGDIQLIVRHMLLNISSSCLMNDYGSCWLNAHFSAD